MPAVPQKPSLVPRAVLALASALLLAVLLVPYAAIEALRVKVPVIGGTFAMLETVAPKLDVEHLIAFALVGALARFAQARPRLVRTMLGLAAFGTVTELAQLWVPTRSATGEDLVLNLVGSVLGYAAAALLAPSALTPALSRREREKERGR